MHRIGSRIAPSIRALVACVALTATAGCNDASDRTGSSAEDGPLVLKGDGTGGGIGDFPPNRNIWDGDSWAVTIGGLELCVSDPNTTIAFKEIRPQGDNPPLRISGIVRRMTPSLRAAAPEGTTTAPLLGSRGVPPNFAEAYSRGGEPLAGDIKPLVGATVDQACGDKANSSFDFTELLVTAYADETGALITGFEVAYTADGVEHLLAVPWEIAMCGTDVDAEVTPSC